MQVLYRDPEQAAEQNKLLKLLSSSDKDSGGAPSKGKLRRGPGGNSKTRTPGF